MKLITAIWRLLVGIKDFLVLLLMLIFFGGLFVALSYKPNPMVVSSGALVVDLTGLLVEQPSEADPITLVTGDASAMPEHRLRDIERALVTAAASAKVKAVVLDLDRFAGGGQAAITAMGRAIDKVRASGKPVLAYATGYTDDGYQLAAHASEIWLNPLGAVLITGPGGSKLYYKGLLDKLGVNTKVFRVGQFKSAVEPFTRSDQSPAAREASQALANALWSEWQADVGKARPRAKLGGYIAQPDAAIAAASGNIAKAAQVAGLVDQLGDRTAFDRRVAALAGESDSSPYAAIPLTNWLASHPESSSGSAIGVLTIAGAIVDGEAAPGSAGGDSIASLLQAELGKERIKALVVRVDSPGGSVIASEQIRSAILEAKALKLPIVVSMGNLAASGGYWVSTPADKILAERTTITGSIGVFGILPSFEGTLAKLGLSADGVKTTPLSGEPDVLLGTSPEFDRLMQASIDDIYRRFTGLVAESRRLPITRVQEIAEGRVWAGTSAKQIGLIDGYGSLDDALIEAAKLAKLDPKRSYPLFIEQPLSPWKQFLKDTLSPGAPEDQQARDPWSRLAGDPERLLIRALGDMRRILSGPAIQVRCLECPVEAGTPARDRTNLVRILTERLGL